MLSFVFVPSLLIPNVEFSLHVAGETKGRDGVAVQPDILSHVLLCLGVTLPRKGESPISPHLLAILCSALSRAHVLVLGVCHAFHLVANAHGKDTLFLVSAVPGLNQDIHKMLHDTQV